MTTTGSGLVISQGFCPGGGKGTMSSAPLLQKGQYQSMSSFSLRAGDRPQAKDGQRRARWDARHQLVWPNDMLAPNMRTYFDRPVKRVDVKPVPARRLRPYWRLDVPKDAAKDEVYRIFDAGQAVFKDQWQWVPLKEVAPAAAAAAGGEEEIQKSASAPTIRPPKVRTPRRPADLKEQRSKESDWDRNHGQVFSRFNGLNHPNFRSYFDRWKENPGGVNGVNNNDCSWRLGAEKRKLGSFAKIVEIDPYKHRGGLPGQPGWVRDF
eukprot:TRINITY_DN80038_c0_g1_i1.p1 TRINITY_DN80038_c0_g1~~TRINITY_DN80038_c0_g1_i1.p1  ORF type:complete len:265 (-),score=58.63 TRINITY_DN80038_c0_g1_i1:46-840(-)